MKNALDKGNNNLNFVQPTACQVTYAGTEAKCSSSWFPAGGPEPPRQLDPTRRTPVRRSRWVTAMLRLPQG